MNRRSFFKFLGIGAATAVVAPQLLAKEPESPQVSYTVDEFKWEPLHQWPQNQYMYVRAEPKTVPFRIGDLVRYKINKRGQTIAYKVPKSGKWNKSEYYGIAISNMNPGNYGFIQISKTGIGS